MLILNRGGRSYIEAVSSFCHSKEEDYSPRTVTYKCIRAELKLPVHLRTLILSDLCRDTVYWQCVCCRIRIVVGSVLLQN